MGEDVGHGSENDTGDAADRGLAPYVSQLAWMESVRRGIAEEGTPIEIRWHWRDDIGADHPLSHAG